MSIEETILALISFFIGYICGAIRKIVNKGEDISVQGILFILSYLTMLSVVFFIDKEMFVVLLVPLILSAICIFRPISEREYKDYESRKRRGDV